MSNEDQPGEKIDAMEGYRGLTETEKNALRNMIVPTLREMKDPDTMFILIEKLVENQRKVAYMEGLGRGYLKGLHESLKEFFERMETSGKKYPV
jgi:hypothetical protein